MDSLVAKANTGSGTDQLAGFNTASGFAGAVVPIDKNGDPFEGVNPLPVAEQSSSLILSAIADLLAAHKAEDTAHVSGDLGMPLLGIRASADTVTTSNDGDYGDHCVSAFARKEART